MGTFKRCCKNFARDLSWILFASLPLILFGVWSKNIPVSGGFFCDDRSLMYPLKPQTVSTRAYLLIGVVVLPLTTFIVTEFFHYVPDSDSKELSSSSSKTSQAPFSFKKYLSTIYGLMNDFLFGFYLQLGFYIIPKFLSVELRPHFFAACIPVMPYNTTCDDPLNLGRYITDYQCSNPDTGVVFNIYLSFPSGHCSGSFYAAAYLCGYVQSKVAMDRYVRLAVQYTLLLMAIFVAVSRISDHYHHWLDVGVGSLMGIVLGVWMSYTKSCCKKEENFVKK